MSIEVIQQTVTVQTTIGPRTLKNHNRSLRRQQKRAILADTASDLEKIQRRIDETNNPHALRALEKLYNIVYQSYCDLLDSEV